MAISSLPTAPSPSDSAADFNSKAFAFAAALPTFGTEANALASTVNSDATSASTQAGIATTQAGIATTQAGIATTKASDASNSANSASSSASSALTYKDTATTKAADAAASAATAAGHDSTAAASAAAASTYKDAAITAWAASTSPAETLAAFSQSLHYGAVVKAFLYDSSKDSDGGAWRKRTAHTSWYNETINARWLGQQASDLNARYAKATLGSELVTNGTFTNSIAGWTAGNSATLSQSSGSLRITNGAAAWGYAYQAITTVAGKTYVVAASYVGGTSGSSASLNIGTTIAGVEIASSVDTSKPKVFVATGTTTYLTYYAGSNTSSQYNDYDNISVKEITAAGTESGDYYQSTADGKFYRLYKNLLVQSEDLSQSAWTKYRSAVDAGTTTTSPSGTTVTALLETVTSGTHGAYQSFTCVSGATYTWCGFLKASGRTKANLSAQATSEVYLVQFDLTGVTATLQSGTGSATITSVGNGWYWIAATATSTAAGSGYWQLNFLDGSNQTSYTGDATKGMFIIGQVSVGPAITATSYEAKTTAGASVEVFRGCSREFPEQVAIIAESARVVLYDLTATGAPMWMVFKGGSNNVIDSAGSPVLCTSMAQGVLAIGGTSLGIAKVDFTSERISVHANAGYIYKGVVADRNGAKVYASATTIYPAIANATVNDVALTVLDAAPVDPATGLPVPTIFVGTAGGLSTITNAGTVTNSTSTTSHTKVAVDGKKVTAVRSDGTVCVWNDCTTMAVAPDTTYTASSTPATLGTSSSVAPNKATGSSTGLTLLKDNPATVASGMVAQITNSYNTGWQLGAIKAALLADTTAETITASGELVTNGTFATDLSSWTAGGSWSQSSGAALNTAGSATNMSQVITTVSGKTYRLQFDATRSAGTLTVQAAGGTVATITSAGTSNVYFTASSTSTTISFNADSSFAGTVDNVSVKLTEPDRSVKAKGVIINGTLSKTAVASGAGLVAYSGFSAANYLEQPYNSDLDFGTGDFTVCGWLIEASNSAIEYLFNRDSGTPGKAIRIWVSVAGYVVFEIYDGTTTRTATGTIAVDTSLPVHIVCTYTGGTLTTYVNGVSYATATGAALLTLTNTSAVTRLGLDVAGSYPATNAKMALWRVSATLMSTDQIAQAYRDELALFQASAQCTIAGTSTAVTALAYDDVANLLHVGTSWGRTSFNGLVRVDSEATTVGALTSISANQGAVITGGATTGRYYQPAILLRDELRRRDEARKALGKVPVFVDFDAVTSQTTFTLPKGYVVRAVYTAGTLKRLGAAKDYTVTDDGYAQSVVYGSAPGNGVWVTVMATRG